MGAWTEYPLSETIKTFSHTKHSNKLVIRGGEQRSEEAVVEKFPKLMTDTKPQIQELQKKHQTG